eukprot:9356609-Alexandrium_andersonii.AAC.1
MDAILPRILLRDDENGTSIIFFISVQRHAPYVHEIPSCAGWQHISVDHSIIAASTISQGRSHATRRARQALDLCADWRL